ncbi:MAG: saccharopine dehydrogenase NADP-binding domain-containing protein [Oscillospiraceae bacterium]|nr:saccharopine dehydrogenase NADP-binding domain-containing protein [Oscillospiraceae bacterium]
MKILILGVGAQGTTVAQRLDEEPGVTEIICADYDQKATENLVKTLRKARGIKVDGSKTEEIAKIAQGADLLINALPVAFGKQAMDAALAAKTNYQDFAAGLNFVEKPDIADEGIMDWVDGIKLMYSEYGPKFAAIGKTAIIGTGAAPGLICVAARRAVRELDSCETINMLIYEGGEARRFLPFWWSPQVALGDMSMNGVAYIDGKIVETPAFGLPVSRKFPEMNGKEVTMIEHTHDEPVYMGLNAGTHFKGAKNIYFKYGGVGVNFARPLYRAGLLSHSEVEIDGKMIVPFRVILHHLPPAPKYAQEIKEILDEGLVADEGAFVVECYGKKAGKNVMVDAHVSAPGIQECFDRSGLTAEMYQTGQCGFLFTKMFLEGQFHRRGLISTDMLDDGQVDYYLEQAAKYDITLDIQVKEDR